MTNKTPVAESGKRVDAAKKADQNAAKDLQNKKNLLIKSEAKKKETSKHLASCIEEHEGILRNQSN